MIRYDPQWLSGHFGTKTLRHQDSSALNYSAEVCIGAEVSDGHFGIGAEVSHFGYLRSLYFGTHIVMHFILYVAR